MAKFHAQAEARLAEVVLAPVLDPSLLASSSSNSVASMHPNPVASTSSGQDPPPSLSAHSALPAPGLPVDATTDKI